MTRKKFRNSGRYTSSSERSFQEYITNQPAPITTRSELIRLIRGGEDTYLELKLKLSNPERIAQEIVALANTAGGTIVFGVTDQLRVEGLRNPETVQDELIKICRQEIYPPLVPYLDTIAFDDGRRIIALDVEGKQRPYRTKAGKFYLRIGDEKREATREELSVLIDENRPLYYENIPLEGLSENDFDDTLVWSFAGGFEKDLTGKNGYETKNFLQKDLLLAVGTKDAFLPTIAGILLFGKNEKVSEILPRASVTAIRYSGDDKNSELIEKQIFSGNLLTLYESLIKFTEQYCDLWKHKSKKQTADKEADGQDFISVNARGNYHIYSVKEAVANILIHRDLALREIDTEIVIYDNSIEFINPRRTNGFSPPASKAIRYGITQRVNPQIAAIFSRREYGINLPRGGLPMILKQSKHFSGKRAELYTTNDKFKLKILSA
ncbi:MAG: putative DNA binding domain-containing protein [Acidobacteriota bacterium]|jgi:ATP-dependent DNA helicase RecG|nr:putative DNA binding domain-containing protein [Acidobacteriota bacterium]